MDILLSLLLLLVLARLLGELAERAHAPALTGEIFAGIVLGPSLLGLIAPDTGITILANLGIFFLVYLAALELTFEDVKRSIREAGVHIALGAFIVPAVAGTVLGGLFGLPETTAVFLGIALAFTAMPVLVRILSDMELLNSHFGRSLVAAALLCDVGGLASIGILVNVGSLGEVDVLGALVVVFKFALFGMSMLVVDRLFRYRHGALGSWILRQSRRFVTKGATFALPLLVALGFAMFSDLLGLHFIMGAFFGTLIVAEHVIGDSATEEVRRATSAIATGFLGPVFFAFIGLTFVVSSLVDLPLVLAVLATAVLTKIVGGYAGARWSKLPKRYCVAAGIAMNGRGAMELVVAAIGLELGFLDAGLFTILVLTGVATTLMTPLGLRVVLRHAPTTPRVPATVTEGLGGINGGL